MSVDASAVTTAVVLLGAGPAYYGAHHLVSRCRARRSQDDANSADNTVPPATAEQGPEAESPTLEILEDENHWPVIKSFSRVLSLGAREEEQSTAGYTLGLLGYAIGIGNLWRFPYLVGKFGGGAFVLCYFICLLTIAIPLYLMELVMGQYTRRNTINCFRLISPCWEGLGWAQALMLFFALGYYNVLLAYSCIYIASSMVHPLPWASDSSGYWFNSVLNLPAEDEDLSGLGGVQWPVAIALMVVWLMVFFALAFGKKALEKVTWITVVSPVVMLLVLLVRTMFLEGAGKGVEFYIGKFDAHKLADPEVWAIACGQILFSLSPGFGTAITMSSFTKKTEDVYRVCLTVAFSNSLFSFTGGFAIFGILGHLATKTDRTVEELASASGPGLAFIAIAEGMSTLGSIGNVMSVLFFTTLLALGLDSTFAWAETFIAYIADYCKARRYNIPLWRIVGVACFGFFLIGLPYCTRRGNQLLDIIDHYVSSYFLLFSCCVECIMFSVCFGWRRLVVAIKKATIGNNATPTGRDIFLPCAWRVCLQFVVPVATSLLLLQLLWLDIEEMYGGYPVGMQAVGWTALSLCVLLVPSTCWRKGQTRLADLDMEEKQLEYALRRCAPEKFAADEMKAKDQDDAADKSNVVAI